MTNQQFLIIVGLLVLNLVDDESVNREPFHLRGPLSIPTGTGLLFTGFIWFLSGLA